MNNRIKQLAIQAGFFYEDYKDIWYLEYHNETCDEEIKKFAELIVRECAEIADNADATREKWQSIGKFVREHFGVE